LTVSQLQWRLEQEGTSFEKELGDVRAHRAMHLLANTDKSITEIAFELGFTDPSTFSRAARRWFSDTPLAVRRKARRGYAPPR
jgi:AraC-like DNA-binding protein